MTERQALVALRCLRVPQGASGCLRVPRGALTGSYQMFFFFGRTKVLALFFRPIGAIVDLEKCCKMSIWWQKSASMQKRTSLSKFEDHGFCGSQNAANRSHAEPDVSTPRETFSVAPLETGSAQKIHKELYPATTPFLQNLMPSVLFRVEDTSTGRRSSFQTVVRLVHKL